MNTFGITKAIFDQSPVARDLVVGRGYPLEHKITQPCMQDFRSYLVLAVGKDGYQKVFYHMYVHT